MLQVTVSNIDCTYVGLFNATDDGDAMDQALAGLIADHGFFKDNVIVDTPAGHILMLDEESKDPDEIEDAINSENTYWIEVAPVKIGTMMQY